MAENVVQSYSIKPEDFKNLQMLTDLKQHARQNGTSMSYIVLSALNMYYSTIKAKDSTDEPT